MRKAIKMSLGFLFIWYSLNIIGFKIGTFVLVESPGLASIDFVWWVVLVVALALYLWRSKIDIPLIGFLIMWIGIQYTSHWHYTIFGATEKKLMGYNNYFGATHHIIKASNEVLIPDTYHIILHLTLVVTLVLLILGRLKKEN